MWKCYCNSIVYFKCENLRPKHMNYSKYWDFLFCVFSFSTSIDTVRVSLRGWQKMKKMRSSVVEFFQKKYTSMTWFFQNFESNLHVNMGAVLGKAIFPVPEPRPTRAALEQGKVLNTPILEVCCCMPNNYFIFIPAESASTLSHAHHGTGSRNRYMSHRSRLPYHAPLQSWQRWRFDFHGACINPFTSC